MSIIENILKELKWKSCETPAKDTSTTKNDGKSTSPIKNSVFVNLDKENFGKLIKESENGSLFSQLKDFGSSDELFDYLDINKDGKLDENEIKEISKLDGDDESVSEKDLQKHFENTLLKYADKNKDGKLDEDELKEIAKLDGDEESISTDDLKNFFKRVQKGEIKLPNEVSNLNNEQTTPLNSAQTTHNNSFANSPMTGNGINGMSGMNGGSAGMPSGGNYFGNYAAPQNVFKERGLQDMSLDELSNKKNEKETELKTAQEQTQKAYSGETQAIKEAQKDYNEKKEAYEKTIENNKEISQELKDKQKENQVKIDNKKNEISETKSKINTKDNEIKSQQSTITSDKSNIEAIKASISNLESQNSDKEEVKQLINSKLAEARQRLDAAQKKLEEDNAKLKKLEDEKTELNNTLKRQEETELKALEEQKVEIEKEILKNDQDGSIQKALDAFKNAEQKLETTKNEEINKFKEAEAPLQKELDEINKIIDTKNTQKTKRELSVNRLDDPKQLYESMGLKEKGLSYEAFENAIMGYNNLDDEQKKTGYLGVLDTTQNNQNARYYLLDLNNFELAAQSQMKTGSGNMANLDTANNWGSNATPTGFLQVGGTYYSSRMGKYGIRLIGLEQGINDQALNRGTVIHSAWGQYTHGCLGIPADFGTIQQLCPSGTIIYSHALDPRYKNRSSLI